MHLLLAVPAVAVFKKFSNRYIYINVSIPGELRTINVFSSSVNIRLSILSHSRRASADRKSPKPMIVRKQAVKSYDILL